MKRYVDGFVMVVPKKNLKEMERHKDMPMPFDMKRVSYGGFETIVNM